MLLCKSLIQVLLLFNWTCNFDYLFFFTVSFYFICCLHLANEKGLKFDSTGLEDFMISMDDGSAPTFGTFGDGFSQTANKLSGASNPRSKRDKKAKSYVEDEEVGVEEIVA